MHSLITLFGLLALCATAHAKQPPNAVKQDWLALMASGCDLQKHRVRTPFGASALRNTPYALAGYAFKSPGLRALFSADGGWYQPKSKAAPKFSPEVGACIKKLKALEATWKPKTGSLKALKEEIFMFRDTYLDIRGHSKAMDGGPSEWSAVASDDTRAEVICKTCKGLQHYRLICPKGEDCLVFVAGTGEYVP